VDVPGYADAVRVWNPPKGSTQWNALNAAEGQYDAIAEKHVSVLVMA
jgi:hypothetical protein